MPAEAKVSFDEDQNVRRLFRFGDVSAAVSVGRFEGSVKRVSDGATFLRAVELGDPSGNTQEIKVFGQLGGQLPANPQWSGNARLFGPIIFFNTSDSVAMRTFLHLGFGNVLFSFSKYVYHDNRPDVITRGVLRKA